MTVSTTPQSQVVSCVTGLTYIYSVAAINIYGTSSQQSTSVQVKCSGPPSQMNSVIINQTGTLLRFSWTAPTNNGDLITGYLIYILTKPSNLYQVDTTLCDGTKNPALTDMFCEFSMPLLANYNLGDLIDAKVQAINSKGYSVLSNATSSVVYYQSIPQQAITGITGVST